MLCNDVINLYLFKTLKSNILKGKNANKPELYHSFVKVYRVRIQVSFSHKFLGFYDRF